MKVTNSIAEVMMRQEQAFETVTGSLRAQNVFTNGIRSYIVFSYQEPIAVVSYHITENNGDVITTRNAWITDDKFSVTTSRHTSMARRALVIK
jgi:hypothetical protein